MVPGGYGLHPQVGEQEMAVFNYAMRKHVGMEFKPVAVASQVVNGINYIFICSATPAVLDPETKLYAIEIFTHFGHSVKPVVEKCAELAGAGVYGVNSSCVNISQASPYYKGDLGHMFGENSRKAVQDADVVCIVGTYAFPEVFPCLESPFRADAQVFHVDLDGYEIAKNHPVTMGICANPRMVLRKINAVLEGMGRKAQGNAGGILPCMAEPERDGTVMAAFLESLREMADENLIIFDEALTASGYVTSFLPRTQPGTFFQTRGGSLGVGIPGGIGIRLARPDRQVVVFTGDGGSMYTIQALQTAHRYRIPVKIVICNNGRYRLLDENLAVYRREQGSCPHRQPDCFSLEPGVDYVALARSMGVDGVRVETKGQAAEAARMLISSEEAFLVDLDTREGGQVDEINT